MALIADFLRQNPWVWIAALAGMAVWAASIWVIVRSPKFLRKWLWALLTLLNFSINFSVVPNMVAGVSIPLGAIYVLWFWRFGPSPTEKELVEAEARRQRAPPTGSPFRVTVLRICYVAAALCTAIVSGLLFTGELMPPMMGTLGPTAPETTAMIQQMMQVMKIFGVVFGVVMISLWGFLVLRPYWWGKLLCVWAGLAWTMFGLMGGFISGPDPLFSIVLGCGLVMLTCVVALQIADPSFGRSYLRPAGQAA